MFEREVTIIPVFYFLYFVENILISYLTLEFSFETLNTLFLI